VPELPEVESVRRRLEPVLVGRRFDGVEIRDLRLVAPRDPREVAAELEGETVAAVERRGKYLVVRFASDRVLLVHLRMTGSLEHGSALGEDAYRRALVALDDGTQLGYRDVRRFGTWLLLEAGEDGPYLAAKLGDEPLEEAFTVARLRERLKGRRAPIKAALLDQRTLAGMGNIYVDEALWRARIHPLHPAQELSAVQVRLLHEAIRAVLELGIARQGSTLRDYRLPDGASGSMQTEFRVYGREGEPCERCGRPIAKTKAGGRGTWFCSRCQR
jgi:formamidopyrimidine-DNA glycosylase